MIYVLFCLVIFVVVVAPVLFVCMCLKIGYDCYRAQQNHRNAQQGANGNANPPVQAIASTNMNAYNANGSIAMSGISSSNNNTSSSFNANGLVNTNNNNHLQIIT